MLVIKKNNCVTRSKLVADAVINKENVLQITNNRSKITLQMHDILIKNIAVKGE